MDPDEGEVLAAQPNLPIIFSSEQLALLRRFAVVLHPADRAYFLRRVSSRLRWHPFDGRLTWWRRMRPARFEGREFCPGLRSVGTIAECLPAPLLRHLPTLASKLTRHDEHGRAIQS
jgi:hypothetical protein